MRNLLKKAILSGMRSAIKLVGERGKRLVLEACEIPLKVSIEHISTKHGKISFYCMNDLSRWRATTLLEKEPETIEWIDKFDVGDVFWDIGANVGVYTLYAAAANKGPVVAFEPSSSNYSILNRNIEINEFSKQTAAYCIAMSDECKIDVLYMQSTDFGGSLSSFGDPIDHNGNTFSASFLQGMVGFSPDQFVSQFDAPFPNRLKIDVDGIEDRIIAGSTNILADTRLKSVSIELDENRPDYTGAIIAKIENGGLRLASKRHAHMFNDGPHKNIYNYQFFR